MYFNCLYINSKFDFFFFLYNTTKIYILREISDMLIYLKLTLKTVIVIIRKRNNNNNNAKKHNIYYL